MSLAIKAFDINAQILRLTLTRWCCMELIELNSVHVCRCIKKRTKSNRIEMLIALSHSAMLCHFPKSQITKLTLHFSLISHKHCSCLHWHTNCGQIKYEIITFRCSISKMRSDPRSEISHSGKR